MKQYAVAIAISLGMVGTGTGAAWAADAGPGKAVFEKSCAGCHGKDGKGNPAMAKALGEKGLDLTSKDAKEKSDDQLLKTIAEGSGKMPAQKSLSKDEQKQALGHVRSLQK